MSVNNNNNNNSNSTIESNDQVVPKNLGRKIVVKCKKSISNNNDDNNAEPYDTVEIFEEPMRLSSTIMDYVSDVTEGLTGQSSSSVIEIVLPEIESKILKRIYEYCEHHYLYPTIDPETKQQIFVDPDKQDLVIQSITTDDAGHPLKNLGTVRRPKRTDNALEWDLKFMEYFTNNPTRERLSEWADFINRSCFLVIRPLTDLCAKMITKMIKGKDYIDVQKLFHIKNPYSPEETERLYKNTRYYQIFHPNK